MHPGLSLNLKGDIMPVIKVNRKYAHTIMIIFSIILILLSLYDDNDALWMVGAVNLATMILLVKVILYE